jgi:glycosyltransferase involved in cell wall biosynthesis
LEEKIKKIKIMRVITRLNIGGPAIHTILLTERFNNERFSSMLVKGREGLREGDMYYYAREKGVEPIMIPELQREIKPLQDCMALWKLYRLIRKEKPDVVHTHTAKAGVLGRTAAWLAGVPVILHTFHGHVLKGYFGRLRSWIFIKIERVMARISTKIIVISDNIKKELLEIGVAPADDVEVVPLGLELEKFVKHKERGTLKRNLGLSEDCTIVGTVGRLVPIKGQEYFLKAAESICGNGNNSQDVRFVIVGDGELRDKLEEFTRERGLEDKVFFTGFQSDLHEIYPDFDIMVLPSLNEGTPVSLIEAMSSARAVVATKVGGVGDLVHDGVTGYLVDSGSEEELAQVIRELLDDKVGREIMGKKGMERVYPAYDIETLTKRMDDMYSSLLYQDLMGG